MAALDRRALVMDYLPDLDTEEHVVTLTNPLALSSLLPVFPTSNAAVPKLWEATPKWSHTSRWDCGGGGLWVGSDGPSWENWATLRKWAHKWGHAEQKFGGHCSNVHHCSVRQFHVFHTIVDVWYPVFLYSLWYSSCQTIPFHWLVFPSRRSHQAWHLTNKPNVKPDTAGLSMVKHTRKPQNRLVILSIKTRVHKWIWLLAYGRLVINIIMCFRRVVAKNMKQQCYESMYTALKIKMSFELYSERKV